MNTRDKETDVAGIATIERASAPLAVQEMAGPLRPSDVIGQVALIQEVMGAVMKDGEHYGKIPGCGDKPALLQPGAQVLAFTFRLSPDFEVEVKDLPNLHREYVVRCRLTSIITGQAVGMGIGSCSTMESKYRYRNVADFEVTGEPIPADSKERKAEYRRKGFGMKKVDGVWEWVRFKDSAKTENPDIADTYNTVLKMASKRAFVHATLNATAASDMFTQDVEDLPAAAAEPDAWDDGPYAQPRQAAPAPAAAASFARPDEATLMEMRDLRGRLGVSDDMYMQQLAVAHGARVSSDAEISAKAAMMLITEYRKRLAPAPAEAPAPASEEIEW